MVILGIPINLVHSTLIQPPARAVMLQAMSASRGQSLDKAPELLQRISRGHFGQEKSTEHMGRSWKLDGNG